MQTQPGGERAREGVGGGSRWCTRVAMLNRLVEQICKGEQTTSRWTPSSSTTSRPGSSRECWGGSGRASQTQHRDDTGQLVITQFRRRSSRGLTGSAGAFDQRRSFNEGGMTNDRSGRIAGDLPARSPQRAGEHLLLTADCVGIPPATLKTPSFGRAARRRRGPRLASSRLTRASRRSDTHAA